MIDAHAANEGAKRRLGEAIASGRAVAVVGAGASVPLYPQWRELIGRLAHEALTRGRVTDETYDAWTRIRPNADVVLGRIRDALEDDFQPILCDIFKPKPGPRRNSYTDCHRALMRVPFLAYVTTNYDLGLVIANVDLYPEGQPTPDCTWRTTDRLQRWLDYQAFEDARPPILHAHGVYNEGETMILTKGDYCRLYDADPGETYREVLHMLASQYELVFVGASLKDPRLGRCVEEAVRRRSASVKHFAITGVARNEMRVGEERSIFREAHSMEPIYYVAETDENDAENHKDLLEVLEGLVPEKPIDEGFTGDMYDAEPSGEPMIAVPERSGEENG